MMNRHLADNFNCVKPQTSSSCKSDLIRNLILHSTYIKHEYACYGKTNYLSISNQFNNSILEKTTTHSLHGYKMHEKNRILASYQEACNTVIFYTCKINDLPVI